MKEKPELLSIEITTQCNLSCNNCFALAALDSRGEWDLDEAKAVVREGLAAGFEAFHLTGGEPLLWKGLREFVPFVFDSGYGELIINTNGILLDREMCLFLKDYRHGLTLTCSLNGPEERHDAVRGPGSRQKAVKGIRAALDQNLKVHIFTTVNRSLLPELPRFIDDLFSDLPALEGLYLLQLRRVTDDAYPLRGELLRSDEFIQMVRMAGYLRLKGLPIAVLDNPLANIVAEKEGLNLPLSSHLIRRGKLIILCDRRITGDHTSRRSYGNYRPGALAKALALPERQDDLQEDTLICPDCAYYSLCRNRGLFRPSSKVYSAADQEEAFCRQVLRNYP